MKNECSLAKIPHKVAACYRKKYCSSEYSNLLTLLNYYIKEMKLIKQRQKFELVKSQTKYCIYIILFLYLHIASFIIVYIQMTINNYLKLFIILNRLYTKQFQQIIKNNEILDPELRMSNYISKTKLHRQASSATPLPPTPPTIYPSYNPLPQSTPNRRR